jgi:hypothetical protein
MTVKSNVMMVRNQHQVSNPDPQGHDGAPQYLVHVELQGFYGSKNGHFTDTSFFGGLCGQMMK